MGGVEGGVGRRSGGLLTEGADGGGGYFRA